MFMMVRRILRQIAYAIEMEKPASMWRKLWLRLQYNCYVSRKAQIFYPDRVVLGDNAHVYQDTVLNFKSSHSQHSPSITIGRNSRILPGAKIIPQQGYVKIGDNCTIQYGCLLYGVGGLEIGDDTRIAAYTVISPMNHIYADPSTPIWKQGETAIGIRIGKDVWIGTGVKILDGVTIGDGAVVGAGSVVTESIPPFSVAVGVPARVIKKREGRMPEGSTVVSLESKLKDIRRSGS